MKRTNFYNVVTVAGTNELDFLWNSLSIFKNKMRYPPSYYRVTGSDIKRPDLISYKNYGSVKFWWIILLVNDISNPLVDMVEGQVIIIPNQLDIFNFQRKFRVRRSN